MNSNLGMPRLLVKTSSITGSRPDGCLAGASVSKNPRTIPGGVGDSRGSFPKLPGIIPGIDPRIPGDTSGIPSAKSFGFGDQAKNRVLLVRRHGDGSSTEVLFGAKSNFGAHPSVNFDKR